MDLQRGSWINPPSRYEVASTSISVTTDPGTDFWQRTFYGFQNNNAPAYLLPVEGNFTFTCRVVFEYKILFDQAGILVWIDQHNWIKASIEFDNAQFSRLGVVVTNNGYSDWSTQNIGTIGSQNFRVSRRGPDFLIESRSTDESPWEQLRICHLAALGETTPEMAKASPGDMTLDGQSTGNSEDLSVGVYACSPGASTFTANFDQLCFTETVWMPHV